ncbi:MAG: SpoIIE family protein phosphatase [Clostridia bacterium]|nr:SpoIIE family protein phosphatase [Clostridia bacterium]
MNTTNHRTAPKEATAGSTIRTKTDKEQKTAALLTGVLQGLLYAAMGYFSGLLTLPFGSVPFGLSLLCASEREIPFLAIGLFLSAKDLPHPALRLSAYGLALLLRLVFALPIKRSVKGKPNQSLGLTEYIRRLFSESLALRIVTALLSALLLGTLLWLKGDRLYYHLYGLLLTVAAAPIGTAVFSGLSVSPQEGGRAALRHEIALLAISAATVLGARPISLLGVSLAPFLAMLLGMIAIRKYGFWKGLLAASLLGLAASPSLFVLFALSALGAAVLMPLSPSLAAAVAMAIGIGYGYSARGLALLTGLFPAILSATLLFSVANRLFFGREVVRSEAEESQAEEQAPSACVPLTADGLCALRLTRQEQSIRHLCQGLERLSRELNDYSRSLCTSEQSDYATVCEEAFHSCCRGCSEYELCYGEKQRHTREEILRLGGLLQAKEAVEREDVSAELTERCPRLPDILDEINHRAHLCTTANERGKRAEQFAEDYGGFARLIRHAAYRQPVSAVPDEPLSRALAADLTEAALPITAVAVTCPPRSTLCLRTTAPLPLGGPGRNVRELCDRRLPFEVDWHEGSCDCICEDPPLFEWRFLQKERISVKSAVFRRAAEGEGELCGDHAQVFHGEGSRFFACISDGMGSGREAAETSSLAGRLLQTLLSEGAGTEDTLRLLNHLLRHRGNGSLHECSATVDLMELDLTDGQAVFYKCGAAPTYILRGGSLVKLRSGTLPIGILQQVDTGVIPCRLDPGDTVVMVSDGVTQGREECPHLFELLQAKASTSDPERLASLIVSDAQKRGSTDDISVTVIKIA